MKETLYLAGLERMRLWCGLNKIPEPTVKRLARTDRLYHLATCAYYRSTTITIMVEKCAHIGTAARAWSCPGYVIDRTPYGVIQHELGHHVDLHFTFNRTRFDEGVPCEHPGCLHHVSHPCEGCGRVAGRSPLFSKGIWELSREDPLTGYLGTDERRDTFYMEWFAEIFRLYVTNPDLCMILRPHFYKAMSETFGLLPLESPTWEQVLVSHNAPARTIEQARKKIEAAESLI